jgi:hypothetical protein
MPKYTLLYIFLGILKYNSKFQLVFNLVLVGALAYSVSVHGPDINWARPDAFSSPHPLSKNRPAFQTLPNSLDIATELKMALLVDKLRPRTLDALTYHPDLSDRLRSLVREPRPRNMTALTQATTNRPKTETSPIY